MCAGVDPCIWKWGHMSSLIYLLQVVLSRFSPLDLVLGLALMISLCYFWCSLLQRCPYLYFILGAHLYMWKTKMQTEYPFIELRNGGSAFVYPYMCGAIYTPIQLLKCFICGQLSTNASCINCLPNIICKIQHLRGKKTHTHHQYIAVMYIFPSTVGHDTFVARSLHVSAPPHHFVLEESKVTEEVEIYWQCGMHAFLARATTVKSSARS
jgi:hypothetical protein